MKNAKDLLQLYKEYESALREKNVTPLDYENQVDDLTSNRLRMCRTTRNYLTHQNDPGFLEVSDDMIKFMEKMVLSLKKEFVKQNMKNSKYILPGTMKCVDAFAAFGENRPLAAAVNIDGEIKLVSMFEIAKGLAPKGNVQLAKLKTLKEKPVFAAPLDKMATLPVNRVVICTEDGTKSGKVLGVIYR